MCLISIGWQAHEQYPLLLAANRDEFLQRETREMHFWETDTNILAGQDLVAGGTWMGFHRNGRLAALTNIRHPDYFGSGELSRGELIPDFLTRTGSVLDWAAKLQRSYKNYHGFNLLFGDQNQLYYFGSHAPELIALKPGVYGLCNADIDTPWPKLELAKKQMSALIASDKNPTDLTLSQLHSDHGLQPDDLLPDTGIPLEFERSLSAQFIELENYGTRAQTGARVNNAGRLSVTEFSTQTSISRQFTIDSFWSGE